ncbi:helix-turn-helix domain-containing protein [Denitratisoma oestradiolicum]|nr:helix-turn-helix transcriptional regulator [Denitratisoma oestradiolicum]
MNIVFSQETRIISAIRAARAALNWTQPDLAKNSGVALVTIARMESGMMSPRLSTLAKLKAAIETAGVRIADDYPPGGYTLTVSEQGISEAAGSSGRNLVGTNDSGTSSES